MSAIAAGLASVAALVLAGPATAAPPDTAAAPADTAAAPPAPPWNPDPSFEALSLFRPERSAGVEEVLFRDRRDAVEPPGLASLAAHLRLSPNVRTREMSQGPTAESFDLSGAGSGRSALLLDGATLALPGTSGPHSHEIALSEIDGFSIVRGGAAALYGPDAVDGAVVALPRRPLPDDLTTRVTAEEGVDDFQRGQFQVARRFGASAGLFVTTESRRIDGFFPGTAEVDRFVSGTLAARTPWGTEGSLGWRRSETDGRMGGFDPATIRSAVTKRDDLRAKLFRRTPAGGVLLEADVTRERLETGAGGRDVRTREFVAPLVRVTADLPSRAGVLAAARAEGRRLKIDHEEEGRIERFGAGAGALRLTRGVGAGFATATGRVDAEEGRPPAWHGRVEGEVDAGRLTLFAIGSTGERLPDRGAEREDDPEVHRTARLGLRLATGPFVWHGAAFATDVRDFRREPTFEEIRARRAVLDGPEGDAELRGTTAGFDGERFAVPGLRGLGELLLRSSVTWLSAENVTTGERLPRRPRFAWTGEGLLERRFFKGELLARVRGRLTHAGDRVDGAGAAVEDAWVTDVLLEGEVGDAVFWYRFHDLLERADEIEPGIRLPGFSRMWGITWRFEG